MEKKSNIVAINLLSIAAGVAGIVLCGILWFTKIFDDSLFSLYITDDISPTVTVIIITLFSLVISMVFYFIGKSKNILIPVSIFFASFGITNSVCWVVVQHCELSWRKQISKEYIEKKGYKYIGDVEGYYVNDDGRTVQKDFGLYVKIIYGKKHFYCTDRDSYIFHLVQRHNNGKYGIIKWSNDIDYIIQYDFDWEHVYVKNLSSNSPETNTTHNSGKTIYENQRQPELVYDWDEL